jgi:hypothetical protein
VADVDFDGLRELARFVLEELARGGTVVQFNDPQDPMDEVKTYNQEAPQKASRAPRLPDTLWARYLDACGGDPGQAKGLLDRVLKDGLQKTKNLKQ